MRVPTRLICALVICVCYHAPVLAQAEEQDEPGLITLKFPDPVELKVLADYVSERMDINILYDEQINGNRITLKAPEKVPADSLLGLLEGALKLKGMALVDAEQPGWKKIVQVRNLVEIAGPPKIGDEAGQADKGASRAVTQIFQLSHSSPQRVDQLIKPFLTPNGGNSYQVAEHNMLVVTDYAGNVDRVSALIDAVDREPRETATKFLPVKNMSAQELAQQIGRVLSARSKARGVEQNAGVQPVDVMPIERTNQIMLVGGPTAVEQAVVLVASLDVALNLETKMYTFASASPERIDRLVKELVGDVDNDRIYKSAIDEESNTLIVTSTGEIHRRVEALKEDFDQIVAVENSPIRFYELKNAVAADVLETIRSLNGQQGGSSGNSDTSRQPRQYGFDRTQGRTQTPGQGIGSPANPSAVAGEDNGSADGTTQGNDIDSAQPAPLAADAEVLLESGARVMSDKPTNSIIVVGPPDIQQVYKRLIERLDKRRPQVLLEVTVVTLDTSGGYSFGVDASRSGSVDGDPLLAFGSFGLSEVDADTGRLTLTPGLGFNGALLSSDIADVVVRALKTNSRAKVVSAPKILVSDHATGTLTSISEAPFTSVNASDTVATTSFAGFASAGTTINMTPHIAEGDHLQLQYTIDLSSFTGSGSESVPPPRQTNAISSDVMIPDGSTIIVGGLNRTDSSDSRSTIPIVDQIPLIGDLIGETTSSGSQSTLFVFIRPVILRDDQFRDLKYYSRNDARKAQLPSDLPQSDPLLMN